MLNSWRKMGNSNVGRLKGTRFDEALHCSIMELLLSDGPASRPVFTQLYLEAGGLHHQQEGLTHWFTVSSLFQKVLFACQVQGLELKLGVNTSLLQYTHTIANYGQFRNIISLNCMFLDCEGLEPRWFRSWVLLDLFHWHLYPNIDLLCSSKVSCLSLNKLQALKID